MPHRQNDVVVTQDPEKPVAPEVLADAIVRIAGGFEKLKASGLNRRAVEALVFDSTRGVSKGDICAVLDSLEGLAKRYTNHK